MSRFDALGKEHTFYFAVMMTTGLGVTATEWINGEPGGYQFFVLVHPETPVHEAYDKLIQKIESGLAHRYLRSSDFPGDGASQNRLYIDGTAVIPSRQGIIVNSPWTPLTFRLTRKPCQSARDAGTCTRFASTRRLAHCWTL